jgi:mRNA interferase RelE/StbE
MGDYEVQWERRALKQLAALPRKVILAVDAAGESLAKDPRPDGVRKLHGELEGLWRIRVRGSYRLVYEIDDDRRLVWVVKVGARGSVY